MKFKRGGQTGARKDPSTGRLKDDWISRFEASIAAVVAAVENLVRTQFALMFGRGVAYSSLGKHHGKGGAGPYSSLLFSIVVWIAIFAFLNTWLDSIENVEDAGRFSVSESFSDFSWIANLGIIIPMLILVPILGSALSFLIRTRDSSQRVIGRDMYIYAISSYVWHQSLFIAPMFAWALVEKQTTDKFWTPGSAEQLGISVLSNTELLYSGLMVVLITLRAAWIYESGVNRLLPQPLPRRIGIYVLASLLMPFSVTLSIQPVMQRYFDSTDHLSVLGSAKLVDIEEIELELVFTNDKKNSVVILSSDISFFIEGNDGKSISEYPIHFYSSENQERMYVVLEPGRPTVVQATAYFRNRGRVPVGVWPVDSKELRSMSAGICVVYRAARKGIFRNTRCQRHQTQGPRYEDF